MKIEQFLLEIGVEEIPSDLITVVESELKQNFLKELENFRISYKDIYSFSTPSRVIISGNLESFNSPEIRKIQGPSFKVGFDTQGNCTPACLGFLRSQKAKIEDVVIEDTKKGKYLFIIKKEKAQHTEILLKKIIPLAVSKISLPKYMRWDNSGLKFIRPLRWVISIFGDKFLRIKIGKLISSDFTIIRKGSEYKKVKIKNIKDYFRKLEKEKVIISFDKRKAAIEKGLKKKADNFKSRLHLNPGLISEVSNLVERPYILSCGFKKEFLKLPSVVLLASMAKYQRVFALRDRNDKLLNKFLAVIESKPSKLYEVKKHYEFVLNARLYDAAYFFREDTREPLDNKIPFLRDVLLHNKLGSIYDKVEALKAVAERIAKLICLKERETKAFLRAVHLFKADLVTKMVYEFPSLEGLVGGIYAKYFGENDLVVTAISEHYRPRTNEDSLPNTKLGALLSLIDKSYNVIGILGIGELPTGSEDPFTLRRQTQAIMRILIQYQFRISLPDLFLSIYEQIKNKVRREKNKIYSDFINLCRERFQVLMREERIPQDLITAVVNVNFQIPAEVYLRIRKLLSIYNKKGFFYAAKVIERTAKIIKDEEGLENSLPEEDLFQEDEEKKLWRIYLENKEEIQAKIRKGDYEKATLLYGEAFYDIIHLFFDKVLVNVEDSLVRRNRKGLLYLVNSLLSRQVADLKEMEVLKNERKK